MTTAPKLLWRVAPAGKLLMAEMDGQTVVYHTGAGHTHWISAVTAAVLRELATGPKSSAQLHAALSELTDPEDEGLLEEALAETLGHLNHLDLVEAA